MAGLEKLLAPRGIALVGARDESLWARNITANLAASGFAGPVYAVHPRRSEVLGLPTVANLDAVAGEVDLAFVLTGAGAVGQVLAEMAAAGIGGGIVLASGFAESGTDGRAAQRRLADRARELGIALLGPNSMGYVNPLAGVAPFGSGQASAPTAGRVAVITQSGALSGGVLAYLRHRGVGLSLLVSTGNEAVVDTIDLIDHVAADGVSRAVALFLEQLPDPRRLHAAVGRAARAGVAVVALKVGRSEAGQRAALAHTGSLAGDGAVASAALRRCGVIETRGLEELITTAGLLAHLPERPRGRRIAAVTASGGAAEIVADRAADVGLSLPALSTHATEALRDRLPPFASVANPLDVTGYESPQRLARHTRAIDEAMATLVDEDVDAVLAVLSVPNGTASNLDSVRHRFAALGRLVADAPVPVVLATYTDTGLDDFQRDQLTTNGLHIAGGMDLAVTALGHAARWPELVRDAVRERSDVRERSAERSDVRERSAARRGGDRVAGGVAGPATTPDGVRDGSWNEDDGRALVAAAGVPVPPGRLARDAAEAVAAAEHLGLPVALKVCSADLTHKFDVGGVRLGLRTTAEVTDAYHRIRSAVAESAPDAVVDGVLVTAMRPPGVEMLAGVRVDPQVGPVLTVGLGGTWVEVLADVVHRPLPVDADDVRAMLAELRGAALLAGGRGHPPADVAALIDTVLGLCRCAEGLGSALREIELNPIVVHPEGAEALDVLVVTGQRGE
jgi:acyl-CoA synthetase (NDP forming)